MQSTQSGKVSLAVSPSPEVFGPKSDAWRYSGADLDRWAKEKNFIVKRDSKSVFLIDPETFQIGRIQLALDAVSHLSSLSDLGDIDFSSLDKSVCNGLLELMGASYSDSIGPIIAGNGAGRIQSCLNIEVTDGDKTFKFAIDGSDEHDKVAFKYSKQPTAEESEKHEKQFSGMSEAKSAFGLNYSWAPGVKNSKDRASEIRRLTEAIEAELDRQQVLYDSVWPKFIQKVHGKKPVPNKGDKLSELSGSQIDGIRANLMSLFGNDKIRVEEFLSKGQVVNANPIAMVYAGYVDEKGFKHRMGTQLNVRRRFWK